MDSKERFTAYAGDYVKYRPGYPPEAIDSLLHACGLAPGMAVADVGAGTGKLTGPLLARGLRVYAVEPNDAMRTAMEQALAGTPGFLPVKASAEETGLPDASVEAVTAAQAFHWFDRVKFREECRRILRPGGKVALVWNRRDTTDAFQAAYEDVIQAHHDDMPNKTMRDMDEEAYASFFAHYDIYRLASRQSFDCEGLVGRALSSSYAPRPGHPRHEALCEALQGLFERHQKNGQVTFAYQTEVVVGEI
jgi:SAM-dependent methyltransferase